MDVGNDKFLNSTKEILFNKGIIFLSVYSMYTIHCQQYESHGFTRGKLVMSNPQRKQLQAALFFVTKFS